MRAVAWLGLVVACGDPSPMGQPDAAVDAGPTGVMYQLLAAPPPDAGFRVSIDGLGVHHVVRYFPTQEAFHASNETVELHAGETLLDRFVMTSEIRGCDERPVSRVSDVLCVLDNGELRYLHSNIDGICYSEQFCVAPCLGGCGAGQHCTARVTSREPRFSKMACAPFGSQPLGAACTLVDDPDGAYDNCASGAVCIDGTCRPICLSGCDSCAPVPGYPPEIRNCP